MNNKPNYFKIGLFVIIAFALIVTAIVILGSGIFAKEKVYFETYFDSSVSGLSVGAPVEYRGVQLGNVEKITFLRQEYDLPGDMKDRLKYEDYILVICSSSNNTTPDLSRQQRQSRLDWLIKKGLRIRLASNILTGQAYLEADQLDPERFPVPKIIWEPKNIYIPSAPGTFSTIKDSIDNILFKMEQIEVEQIATSIQEVFEAIKQTLADANIDELSAQLVTILDRIDQLIASEREDLDVTLENLREVSENLKDITESIKKNPSELIRSQPPPRSEVLK